MRRVVFACLEQQPQDLLRVLGDQGTRVESVGGSQGARLLVEVQRPLGRGALPPSRVLSISSKICQEELELRILFVAGDGPQYLRCLAVAPRTIERDDAQDRQPAAVCGVFGS